MAKNGNLPQMFLKRILHKYPSMEGYPYIILPFVIITMSMSAFIAGEVKIGAQVYGIAFLGVMVSFACGVLLMRNKGFKKTTPVQYLSKHYITYKGKILSLPALLTAFVLGFAFILLISNSDFSGFVCAHCFIGCDGFVNGLLSLDCFRKTLNDTL